MPMCGSSTSNLARMRTMSSDIARGLLVLAVVVGLASLVLAFKEPSMIGPWLTALAMVFVAAAQIIYLRKKPPGRR
jgi:hypothetical protein